MAGPSYGQLRKRIAAATRRAAAAEAERDLLLRRLDGERTPATCPKCGGAVLVRPGEKLTPCGSEYVPEPVRRVEYLGDELAPAKPEESSK